MPKYFYRCPECPATFERIVSIEMRDKQECSNVIRHRCSMPKKPEDEYWWDECCADLIREEISIIAETKSKWGDTK